MERKQFIKSLLALPLATKAFSADPEVKPNAEINSSGHRVMKSTYFGQVYHPKQVMRAFLETLEGLTEEERSLEHIGILGMNKTITIKYIELYSAEKINPARYVNSILKTARSQQESCIEICRHFGDEVLLQPNECDFKFVQDLIRKGKTKNVFLLDYYMTTRYPHNDGWKRKRTEGYGTDHFRDGQFKTSLLYLSFAHNLDHDRNEITEEKLGGKLLRKLNYEDLYSGYGFRPSGPMQPSKHSKDMKLNKSGLQHWAK